MKPFINPSHCPPLEESSTMASPIQPQSTNNNRPASGATSTTAVRPAEQQGLNCPRCDSPNTKFCYYNNYSLTQPRHYCKTCRRYWTRGGALRNVPIGGGCRKSKKSKSSRTSSSSSSSHPLPHLDPLSGFHLGNMLPYNYPVSGVAAAYDERLSIESLSSINQDMHWKLQQQRLQTMMVGGEAQDKPTAAPIDVERSRADQSDTATAWFLQTPYSMMPNVSTANAATTTNTNSSIYTNGDWNVGIPSWSDMHQFTALP